MLHEQMNLIAELQSVTSQVEDKGDHVLADLLVRTKVVLVDALEAGQNEIDRLHEQITLQYKAYSAAVARSAELEKQKPVAHILPRHLKILRFKAMSVPVDALPYTVNKEGSTIENETTVPLYAAAAGASPQPAQPSQARELSDDGDALRLANRLHMTIAHEPSRGGWSVGAIVNDEFKWLAHEDDDLNRAIVRAAAEIGIAINAKGAV